MGQGSLVPAQGEPLPPPSLAASLADPHGEEFIPSLSTSGQWARAGQRVVPSCPCVLRGQPHLPLTSMPAPPLLEADEEAASTLRS